MGTTRSLKPQDKIAQYRIVRALGAGGMGEVYLAHDETLGRHVALKILPLEMVKSEERVRRFVREARSASSLNHPNIITIYEIGEDVVRTGDESDSRSGSTSFHFISMELVSGTTLAEKIHETRADLRTLLRYLAQAADGLAKAHAAGVVHRDLKPTNIMVSRDGFTKILDFGLAKLTEGSDGDDPGASTQGQDGTRAGIAVGTVGYMSPEQIRGQPVDTRSDLFSFGCILYEAVARIRPFTGESSVETLHKILHESPVPVEQLNPDVPREVRRLIRRCLMKDPEARLQSAKDLAADLREIVDEYDSLGRDSDSDSSASRSMERPKRRLGRGVLVGVGVAAILTTGFLVWRRSVLPESGTKSPQMKVVTDRGFLTGLALSPDRRFLAYGLLDEGQRSIWVRQLATGSDVLILPPPLLRPANDFTFSNDGNYLYYRMDDPQRVGYSNVFEIPVLGGIPKKRLENVDSRITFSPDGKQVAFRRSKPETGEDQLVLRTWTGPERILGQSTSPSFFGDVAWSPDGKRIAIQEFSTIRGGHSRIVAYRVRDGHRETIGPDWAQMQVIGGISWLPDGKSLVVSASDRSIEPNFQLWTITYPQGKVRRLTNDTARYMGINVSADGKAIAVGRQRLEANLWMTSKTGTSSVRRISFGGEDGRIRNFDPASDSTVVFEIIRQGTPTIRVIREDGTGDRNLTEGEGMSFTPFYRPGRGIFYGHAGEDLVAHVYLADPSFERVRQLTRGSGEQIVNVAPDGSIVVLTRDDLPNALWSLNVGDGRMVQLAPMANSYDVVFSPDGKYILFSLGAAQGGVREIVPTNGRGAVRRIPFPPGTFGVQWAPDGKSITYLNNSNLLRNLYRMSLEGGQPAEITHFTEGRIFRHVYSPDGKRMLLRREMGRSNAVNLWVANADGSNPIPVTDFETGTAHFMKWTGDGARIVFTYGQISNETVLVQDFN